MTAAESINLRDKLIRNPDPDPMRPLNYHDRTLHVLPNESCKLQTLLDDTRNYARDHEMQINQEKTKVILFNTARNFDFMPSLSLDDGLPLDVVEEVHLLLYRSGQTSAGDPIPQQFVRKHSLECGC